MVTSTGKSLRVQSSFKGHWNRKNWRFGAFFLAFLVSACSLTGSAENQQFEPQRASHLFAVGYEDVTEIYIEDVRIGDLAMAGLESLSDLDPEVSVTQTAGSVMISVNGDTASSFSAPGPKDAIRWGEVTAATVTAGRQHSNQLASLGVEDIYETIFDGLTAQLDGFSRYAGREEARENRASRDGFGGIGVRISLVERGVKIVSVMENTPAQAAGLEDGDVIIRISTDSAAGLTQRDVVRKLRGPIGTTIALTLDRESLPAPISVEVKRAHIVPQTVSYRAEGKIAYIRIAGFNQNTARTLRDKAIQAKAELKDELVGFVLDLRNNPGGLLDQSVAVSDLFLNGGRIVSTHGRHPDSHQYFEADSDDVGAGKPIVILVNGNSASAAEIVAAALQDTGRAVVVGSTSFGKGTVQTVLRLPNEGELTLTWARFHAPTGYSLNRRGVFPDICTSRDLESSADALSLLRSGALPVDVAIRRSDISPLDEKGFKALRARCPAADNENEIDLELALDLLRNPELYARALRASPATAKSPADQISAASAPLASSHN